MTTKQKVTIAAFVVIILIIIWQVMGLMGGGAPTSPATPAKMAATNKQPNQMMTNAPPGAPAGGASPAIAPNPPGTPMQPGMNPAAAVPPEQQQLKEVPVNLDANIVELQKQTEQKYIDQVNQLQSLKLQKEIAETNQAIASAKLATVTAEKSVSDLLTKQAPQPIPYMPASAFNVAPGQGGVPAAPPTEGGPASNVPPPPLTATAVVPYTVISVSMELGKWSAVLGLQGKLYNVYIGDVLPIDGSVVTSINKNGVILVKDGKRRKISIISSL
ncbi:MAG: hypothetical protein ACYCQI_09695 [Gammaproteobacteria bacterium]